MNRTFIITTTILITIACMDSTRLVKIKNEDGQVIESYYENKDSLKSGIAKSFDESGKLFEEANYNNGVLEGVRFIYYPNGNIEVSENYVSDKLDGAYKVFYEDGNIKQKATYNSGVLEGIVESFYQEGGLKETVQFENNQENGPFVEFYQNGNIKWEGNYLNGDNEFGLLSQYDSTETLIKKMVCDSLGMCQTVWTLEDGDIEPLFKLKQ